jgi:hypothetical protein
MTASLPEALCFVRIPLMGARIALSGDERGDWLWEQGVCSGQWRAMRDGSGGIHGNRGNMLSVSYRL